MTAVIQCERLGKSFGRKTALHDVSFTVNQGDTTALIGPNGAGKTTLFSILCGYLQPDRGRVSVLSQKPGGGSLFGQLSALPQDAQFDPGFSIGEQLEFYGRLQGLNTKTARSEMQRVLTLVGLESETKQKAGALSHGMRKRAAIAQAFIGAPKLVLLDEPTAGLDPANALAIRKLISSLSGEVSFLISSHNIFELEQLCNSILYLEHGSLKAEASNQQVAGQTEYLTLQLEKELSESLRAELQKLPGLISLEQPQKKQLVFCTDNSAESGFDLALLQFLAANGARYRSLTKGQTLEQKLFNVG